MMPLVGSRDHNPVGVGLQEATEFPWGGEGIVGVDDRSRPWGLNWPPKQHYRGVGFGCSFTSHRCQESKHPTSRNQVLSDVIE